MTERTGGIGVPRQRASVATEIDGERSTDGGKTAVVIGAYIAIVGVPLHLIGTSTECARKDARRFKHAAVASIAQFEVGVGRKANTVYGANITLNF